MGVQTLRAKAPVERFYERFVGRRAWPGEVKGDAFRVGPQVEIATDELGALIHSDGLGIAGDRAGSFQRLNNVFPSVAEPSVKRGREARERIDPRLGPGGNIPSYFFFQLKYVA